MHWTGQAGAAFVVTILPSFLSAVSFRLLVLLLTLLLRYFTVLGNVKFVVIRIRVRATSVFARRIFYIGMARALRGLNVFLDVR